MTEAIKSLSDYEHHEDEKAYNLGIKRIEEMNKICYEMSEKDNKNYVLKENPSNKAQYRFAKLDLEHFPETAIPQSNTTGVFYANSTHFKENIDIELFERITKQGLFHSIIQNDVSEGISLSSIQNKSQELKAFVNNICLKSDIAGIRFFT